MEESPKAWGSTPALLRPRGANQGALIYLHAKTSHNEVTEGQINSFRDQPLGAAEIQAEAHSKGRASQFGSGAGEVWWSRGRSMEARTRA